MSVGVFTTDLLDSMLSLSAGQSTIAPLTTIGFGLYQNSPALSRNTTIDQISAASFDGYHPTTISSWSSPYTNLQGDAVISPTTIPTFSCTGSTTINTVTGAYGFRLDTGSLEFAFPLPTPISPVPGQAFRVVPELAPTGQVDPAVF